MTTPRRWDDPDPWNLIAKPILWAVWKLGDRMPKVYKGIGPRPQAESQPDPPFTSLKFCPLECKKPTLTNEFFWAIEQETTFECTDCGGVYTNE